jgi:replicative DNA helicase
MVPPHSDEAEVALLGSLLVKNSLIDQVPFLLPEHFASRVHGRLFETIRHLIGAGKIADPITLKRSFESDPDLGGADGYGYLIKLCSSVASLRNIKDYGRAIHDLFLRRKLIEIGSSMVTHANSGALEPTGQDQIRLAEHALDSLLPHALNRGVVSLGDAGVAYLRNLEKRQNGSPPDYLETGIKTADDALRIRPGQQCIVAGRPSMGKSAFAFSMAVGAASKGCPVAVISLEMTFEELYARAVAMQTGISSDDQLDRPLDVGQLNRVMSTSADFAKLPLHIVDRRGMTASDIRMEARRLKAKYGIEFLVVDHLGLVRPDRQYDSAQIQIGETTQGLRELAGDINIRSMVLCQLNRGVEGREDRRPGLSDLRQSGQIEEHADTVAALYREEYYLSRAKPAGHEEISKWQDKLDAVANKADLIVLKRRGGRTGTFELHFDPVKTRFMDYHKWTQ